MIQWLAAETGRYRQQEARANIPEAAERRSGPRHRPAAQSAEDGRRGITLNGSASTGLGATLRE